jgi:hypothetical protein
MYCFSDRGGEAINGYSMGYLDPGVLRSGLVRDEVTTISVVVESAGRTSRQEINVGLSTWSRLARRSASAPRQHHGA